MKILSLQEWETRVGDTYHMIELCMMPSAQMNEYLRSRIDSELSRKHGTRPVYSQYEQGFVKGLCRARDNRIQRDMMEYCYIKDGVLYSTHRFTTHRSTEEFYQSGRGCELADLPSGFFWKGTDKPFFLSGETTAFRGSTSPA